MWLMIDAICSGYLEFRAMIYGVNPGRYWIDILTMAHCWAIDYFLGLHRNVNFKLTLINSPHFCAVNCGCALSQRLSMDSAVTKFLGVEKKCTYFQDTDFHKLHFGSGEFNSMLEFLHEWSHHKAEFYYIERVSHCLFVKVEWRNYQIFEFYWQSNHQS